MVLPMTRILILLMVWILALASRVLIFGEGGTVGAYVSVGIFWVVTFALIAISTQRLIRRSSSQAVLFALLLIAMLSVVYRAVITSGLTAEISVAVFLLSLLSLIGLSIWNGVKGRSKRPFSTDHTSP